MAYRAATNLPDQNVRAEVRLAVGGADIRSFGFGGDVAMTVMTVLTIGRRMPSIGSFRCRHTMR